MAYNPPPPLDRAVGYYDQPFTRDQLEERRDQFEAGLKIPELVDVREQHDRDLNAALSDAADTAIFKGIEATFAARGSSLFPPTDAQVERAIHEAERERAERWAAHEAELRQARAAEAHGYDANGSPVLEEVAGVSEKQWNELLRMTTGTGVDVKPTNPKDAVGSKKLAMHLVPGTLTSYAALAFTEGALKYGKYNWRVAGVRASIYLDAVDRHLEKYKNGEDEDPSTLVPHLASIIACCGIILDAALCGKLTDDRPPRAPVGELIDDLAGITQHLQALFAGHNPHQHTIEDEEG